MPKPLPLWPGAKPCVQSGYCCRKAPCCFGAWDETKSQCKFLGENDDQTTFCMKYEEIMTKPGWEVAPAFGAGCCSPMNDLRQLIIKKKREKKDEGR